MERHILIQIIVSLGLAVILRLFFRLYSNIVAAPRRVLNQQGIGGPPPALLLGNILEIKKSKISTAAAARPPATHDCGAALFSVFEKWRRQYGDLYTFSLGNTPVLVVNKYDVAKEVTTCTSLDLGRPTYQARELQSLLGNGVLTSNGKFWVYRRKILAPELFLDKVKGMTNLIQQSTLMLIDSWKDLIDGEGGKAEIKIDHITLENSLEI